MKASWTRRPAVMLVLALASVSLVVTLLGKLSSPATTLQKRVPIGTSSGIASYPAFSADSKRIAYSSREGKGDAWHIFVREAPTGTPKQLTRGEDSDIAPVWSPDGGYLAFARIGEEKLRYVVIPADGGAERVLAEFGAPPDVESAVPSVAWTPDGKSVVVMQTAENQPPGLSMVPAEGGAPERITNPPEGAEGDSTPAVAPSGDTIAFVRTITRDGGDLWLCDLKGGNQRRLTFDNSPIRGVVWSRDGKELFYSGNRAHGWHIWRIPSGGGSPRDIQIAGEHAYYPAIGRNRLAWTDAPSVSSIWRASLNGAKDGSEERSLIRSAGRESGPSYSPDGTRIANVSAQTDADEIFLQDADGGNRVQLTHLNRVRVGRPRWSPDGKMLVFSVGTDQGSDVYLMSAMAGAQPGRIVPNGNEPVFSQTGKTIYYTSRGQVWKCDLKGGNEVEVTKGRGGASQPVESADGKFVIYRSRRGFFRVPVAGGEEEEFFVPEHEVFWTTIQPTKRGVYYMEWQRSARGMVVEFYDYATRRSTSAFRLGDFDPNRGTFSVSPDEKYILFPRTDRSQTELMMTEGFK